MASSLDIEDHVTCAVCIEVYTNPYVLKCMHIFCLDCIQKLDRRGRVVCPECREPTNIGDVKKNFQLAGLIESLNRRSERSVSAQPTQQLKCDLCKNPKRPVKSQCVECEECLCTDCETAHKMSKATSHHKIKPVNVMITSYRSSVTGTIDGLKQEKVNLRKKSKSMRENVSKFKAKKDVQLLEVDRSIDKMISQLENHRTDLKKTIKDNNAIDLNKIMLCVELFDKCENDIQAKIDFLSDLVNSEDISVLSETAKSADTTVKQEIEKIKLKLSSVESKIDSTVTVKAFNPQNYVDFDVKKRIHPQRQHRLFSSSATTQYREINNINYRYGRHIEQMCEVDNYIWCTMNDAIHVYNKDLVKVSEIKHKHIDNALGLTKTQIGHVIVACYNNRGLNQLNTAGRYDKQILAGSYSDVACYNGELFALECSKCKIFVLEQRNNDWVKSKEIQLNHSDVSIADRVCVGPTGIFVSSWDNNTVSVYRHTGEFLCQSGEHGRETAGTFTNPLLSDVDTVGNIIVADCWNDRIQQCGPGGQWEIMSLMPSQLLHPRHVLVDTQSQTIWIATDDKIHEYQNISFSKTIFNEYKIK